MSLRNGLSLIPVIEKPKVSTRLTAAEAADKAFKARLRRMELEATVKSKLAAEKQRREIEADEEKRLFKKIEAQREKERRAYFQEIAEIDKEPKMKDHEIRRYEIGYRLEEIRIEEARQKDAVFERDASSSAQVLPNAQKSAINSIYYARAWPGWPGPESNSELLPWFHYWQSILHRLYFSAPLTHLQALSRDLEVEIINIREVIRQRLATR